MPRSAFRGQKVSSRDELFLAGGLLSFPRTGRALVRYDEVTTPRPRTRLLRNSLIGRRPSLVPLPSWRQPLSQVTGNGLTRFYRCLWHASQWRRERISIWTSEQRQGLGDEVIVANVREPRAISHSDRKKDQVEVDGMDEEQATKEALETDQSERRQGGLDGCDGD